MTGSLGDTCCRICSGSIVLEEPSRPITEKECQACIEYFGELMVANAHCQYCGAKYLAWVSQRVGHSNWSEPEPDGLPYIGLSFRASFSDMPAPEDLPSTEVLRKIHHREHMAAAKELRKHASELLAEADEMTRIAEIGKSHWEVYRR